MWQRKYDYDLIPSEAITLYARVSPSVGAQMFVHVSPRVSTSLSQCRLTDTCRNPTENSNLYWICPGHRRRL